MTDFKEMMRINNLAQDISRLALEQAKQSDCNPKELIRAMSAATIALTMSLSVQEHRLLALITLSSAFMDDVLRMSKSIAEEGMDDEAEMRPH